MVLDTALEMVVDEGISAVSIAGIAVRMGVTRPVIYACYPDRASLLNALLDREANTLLTSSLDALHAASGDDPDAAFVAGYRALLDAVSQQPASWRLVFDTSPDAEVASVVANARKVVVDASTRWIIPALRHWWGIGELEQKTPALIELFVSSCEAAVRVMLDPTNDLTVDDLAPLYGRLMSAAYRAA